ncbi:S-layer homology domain-containing protein [Paenibacillus gallinarum]|uniref:S-layer homology domain-containing protein n=1 Tax=Paenibacillus gallinarum TaxID=2762232 RepID=UPI003850D87B
MIKKDTATSTDPVVSLKDISGHWAESAIHSGVTAGYITGYTDQTFKPNAYISRAEFITMLGRALQMKETTSSLTFTDSKEIPSWASSYLSQAVEAEIVSGYGDGTFRAGNSLNRSEITTWMVRAAGLTVTNNASLSFTDKDSVPAWAVPYVATGVKAGLVSGVGHNRFAPEQLTTRAEAAVFIAKLLTVKN